MKCGIYAACTYGHLLLDNDNNSVLPTDGDGGMPGARYCFERILCHDVSYNDIEEGERSNSCSPTWYNRPSGENTVRYLEQKSKFPAKLRNDIVYRSYEVLDMLRLSKGKRRVSRAVASKLK